MSFKERKYISGCRDEEGLMTFESHIRWNKSFVKVFLEIFACHIFNPFVQC